MSPSLSFPSLALPLLLALGTISASGQGLPSSPTQSPDTVAPTLPLSSYTPSELWAIYYGTLAGLEARQVQERANLNAYAESVTLHELSLNRTIQRLYNRLTLIQQTTDTLEQSVKSLKEDTDLAIKKASGYKLEARIAEIAAVLLALGLGASLIF